MDEMEKMLMSLELRLVASLNSSDEERLAAHRAAVLVTI